MTNNILTKVAFHIMKFQKIYLKDKICKISGKINNIFLTHIV